MLLSYYSFKQLSIKVKQNKGKIVMPLCETINRMSKQDFSTIWRLLLQREMNEEHNQKRKMTTIIQFTWKFQLEIKSCNLDYPILVISVYDMKRG